MAGIGKFGILPLQPRDALKGQEELKSIINEGPEGRLGLC